MKVAGVICEYNPFHKGHEYLLKALRREGFDAVVAVMSGSFTQRGEVAILSKFYRTELALKGGADLVIELPTPYAAATAERFACGGCEILKALGCVDAVFFGSECGDREKIITAAKATQDEKVLLCLKEYMNDGEYYPSALKKAVGDIYGNEIAEIISSPNNTLGVEYAKQLLTSSMEIRTVKRVGESHDSQKADSFFASASFIRNRVKNGESVSEFLPIRTDFGNPALSNYGERAMLAKLRSMTLGEIENLPDVNEGLHHRIYEAIRQESTVEGILARVKTKRYTMARLRRILICAFLGITKDIQSLPVSYIRVLGFNSQGELLLKEAKQKASLPFVINVAKDMNNLDEMTKKTLEIDIRATDLRTVFEKSPTACGQDFTAKIIKA
ncbi:MAG: nucleotidyltransferase family protein [Eubacteriales bacterium]|nr:nucleotidyltransferase family protein [Eubacteriales bacterium]